MSARLAPEDVVVIVGKRRSGKSFQAKQLLHSEVRAGARVVAFDPHDEYSRHGKRTTATNLGPLTQRCTVDQLLDAPQMLDSPRLSLAVIPRTASKRDTAEDAKQLINLVRLTGDLTVCWDEVGEYGDGAYDELESMATQSRHWGDHGCPVIYVAQRAVQIPRSARDQASVLITGIQNDPDDLTVLRKITGSPKFAEATSRLPRPGTLTWRESSNAVTNPEQTK